MQTYFRRSHAPTYVGTPESPPAKVYQVKPAAQPTQVLEVYVAGADRRGNWLADADVRTQVRRVQAEVEALTGGASTTYNALGSWRGVSEPVTIVRGAVPRDSDLESLHTQLDDVRTDTDQECVAYSLDGVFYFLSAAVAQ
jgi:hypothetical protein